MQLLKAAVLFLLAAASCTPKAPPAASAGTCPCPKDIMCTEDFRYITLRITDASGNPQTLDRYETVRASTGAVLARVDSSPLQPGTYAVASDAEMRQISTCGEKFFFRGYLGGKKAVDEPYTLRFDCCHVARQSGKEEIQL